MSCSGGLSKIAGTESIVLLKTFTKISPELRQSENAKSTEIGVMRIIPTGVLPQCPTAEDILDDTAVEDQEFVELRQLECKRFIKSGLVDTLERY